MEVASPSWLYWLGYFVKAMVTSRLSGNHPRYQVLRAVSLARCGVLHGRINGLSALRLIRRPGSIWVFWEQPRKELAGWLVFDDPFLVSEDT